MKKKKFILLLFKDKTFDIFSEKKALSIIDKKRDKLEEIFIPMYTEEIMSYIPVSPEIFIDDFSFVDIRYRFCVCSYDADNGKITYPLEEEKHILITNIFDFYRFHENMADLERASSKLNMEVYDTWSAFDFEYIDMQISTKDGKVITFTLHDKNLSYNDSMIVSSEILVRISKRFEFKEFSKTPLYYFDMEERRWSYQMIPLVDNLVTVKLNYIEKIAIIPLKTFKMMDNVMDSLIYTTMTFYLCGFMDELSIHESIDSIHELEHHPSIDYFTIVDYQMYTSEDLIELICWYSFVMAIFDMGMEKDIWIDAKLYTKIQAFGFLSFNPNGNLIAILCDVAPQLKRYLPYNGINIKNTKILTDEIFNFFKLVTNYLTNV